MDETTPHPDWQLILSLGGPAKVAELLGLEKDGGVQRVQNWKSRGIPPAVKLDRPDLFLPNMRPAAPSTPVSQPVGAKAV